jgi:hypothetical protein
VFLLRQCAAIHLNTLSEFWGPPLSSGVFGYYGFGLGGGAGLSATVTTGDPSNEVSVSATARGGSGILGAYGNVGVDVDSGEISPSVGAGWGIGREYLLEQRILLDSHGMKFSIR